ncbi:Phosphatidylinositol-4-phosphate 5-kinase [Plasmopara halstedii]|uniref:Phosphatidylinositol-4-phosphate 5-kinase n=1 Tax=Plasmopara halstedii TaxID=4781 RepID=A0A0P1B2Y3_PLAHL|nr:Phosphatidylinositol-4-phosphate 5-kinase [Plasmopara halstedii]CEG48394.1 Phosphatidylinositol-4-phosphate 5-kinase [Plasmopara halstedii]|eukprot:XP_024584763.1 Phosphatidylinositol-4-phosphate 5-kinase [Plasmopara halstedii]
MVTKSKTPSTGQGDTKAAAAAAEAALANTNDPKVEEESQIKSGTFLFSDGSKYIGDYCLVGGKVVRQGRGSFDAGAEQYEGEWLNDQMHGRGRYCFGTGAIYDGEFQTNLFHGKGTYYWTDGAHYEGSWHLNRMHGDGVYKDKNGAEWRGRFINGKYDNGRILHVVR